MFCGNLMLATWFSSQIENLETFLATSRLEKNYHFHCTGAESRDLRAQGKDLAIFGSRTVAVASTGGVDDHLLAEMFFFSANLVVESPLKNDAWKTILCIFGALCNFSTGRIAVKLREGKCFQRKVATATSSSRISRYRRRKSFFYCALWRGSPGGKPVYTLFTEACSFPKIYRVPWVRLPDLCLKKPHYVVGVDAFPVWKAEPPENFCSKKQLRNHHDSVERRPTSLPHSEGTLIWKLPKPQLHVRKHRFHVSTK